MAVKELQIFSTSLKKKGTFRLSEVMRSIQKFFNEFKYDNTNDHAESSSPSGMKYEMVWNGSRELDEYYKFRARVFLYAYNVREALLEESKEKIHLGEIDIKIEGSLVMGDYRKKEALQESNFLEFLQQKYSQKEITGKRMGQLINEMKILQMKVKKAIDLMAA